MATLPRPPRPLVPPAEPARGAGSLLTQEPLLLVALIIVTLYFGRPVLAPFALALTLSFLLAPAVTALRRLGVGRAWATLLVVTLGSALLGSVLWLVASQLLGVLNSLPSYGNNIHTKLSITHIAPTSPLGKAIGSLEGVAHEFSDNPSAAPVTAEETHANTAATRRAVAATGRAPQPVVIVPQQINEAAYLRQLLLPVIKPIGEAGIVIVFAIYMLLKREDLRNRLLLLAGMGRLNVVTQALDDAAARISRYLIASVLVNAGCGVVFGLGMLALHVPHPLLWGALLALLRLLVPYAGPIVGSVLPIVYALIVFPGWWQAAGVLLVVILLETSVSNFVEPWLYGARTGVSELALMVMAVFWTLLWGWAGLALSTPLTVCLIVLGRVLPQMSFLHVLLGDEAELAPEARFYERLLAMDQAEAHTIADRFLEQRSTVELYDEVVLPALVMAEQDRHKGLLVGDRAEFLLQSAQELITELIEYSGGNPHPESQAQAAAELCAHTRECPVVCIPASDQADEIAAAMLAQLLERMGHKTILLPPAALSPELLTLFGDDPSTTLLISAVPPLAYVPARSLCTRLRELLPNNRIVIGLWGSPRSRQMLESRFAIAGQGAVVSTLAEALSVFRGEESSKPVLNTVNAGAS